ncbi:MAG: hypothetical protein ACXVCS_09015 [Bdellovibrionota bacterium]
MGHLSLILLALLAPLQALAGPTSWQSNWRNVAQLVKILRAVPEGSTVLDAAYKKDPNFAAKIKTGNASFTESTFSRTYSLLDGKEQITLHHEVTINSSLILADAVVDLAHELVHFTEKGMLDPYKTGFELRHFIRNGIEGEGGELAALAVECRVAWALEDAYEGFPQHHLCERYRGPDNAFHREAARLEYYALGSWYSKAGPDLKPVIPEVSKHASVVTSSYAGKPYPVALSEEYAMTRRAACLNNQRKYRLIAAQSAPGRQPASRSLAAERVRLKEYERRYCESVGEGSDATSDDAAPE